MGSDSYNPSRLPRRRSSSFNRILLGSITVHLFQTDLGRNCRRLSAIRVWRNGKLLVKNQVAFNELYYYYYYLFIYLLIAKSRYA
jgi:hypothetical protein